MANYGNRPWSGTAQPGMAAQPGRGNGPMGGEKDKDKNQPEQPGNENRAHDGDPNRSNRVGRSR